MAGLAERADRWIHGFLPLSAESLGIYRVLYGTFLLAVAVPTVTWLGDIPGAFYDAPLGPFRLLTGFPPPWLLHTLSLGLCLATAALVLGWYTRLASVATAVLLVVALGFSYSLGKINSTALLWLVPLVLAWSGWGDAYSLDARTGRAGRARRGDDRPVWPVSLLALLTALLMATAAAPKISSGWLDPGTQAVQGHLFNQYFTNEREVFVDTFVGFGNAAFWEALDVLTVALEAGFVVALLSRRLFRVFLALAVLFHLGVLVMMDIGFTVNIVAYAAFVDWRAVRQRLPVARRPVPGAGRIGAVPAVVVVAAVGLASFVVLRVWGRPLPALLSGLGIEETVIATDLLVTVPAAVGAVAYLAGSALRPLRRRPVEAEAAEVADAAAGAGRRSHAL